MNNLVLDDIRSQAHDAASHYVESLLSCSEIAARFHNAIAREWLGMFSVCSEKASQHVRDLAESRDVRDMALRKARAVNEIDEKLFAAASEVLEMQRQARVELSLCFEDCIQPDHWMPGLRSLAGSTNI